MGLLRAELGHLLEVFEVLLVVHLVLVMVVLVVICVVRALLVVVVVMCVRGMGFGHEADTRNGLDQQVGVKESNGPKDEHNAPAEQLCAGPLGNRQRY